MMNFQPSVVNSVTAAMDGEDNPEGVSANSQAVTGRNPWYRPPPNIQAPKAAAEYRQSIFP